MSLIVAASNKEIFPWLSAFLNKDDGSLPAAGNGGRRRWTADSRVDMNGDGSAVGNVEAGFSCNTIDIVRG